eukprot:CAMPEP_0169165092 /NCGR_PEP_ID=MMETSP1015-20121227/59225_1 /TAXON_ID=342587 /ORGANISM="Karlodinium micrum, Strain CCMP2283" /LENGTH=99 /DNA_ID=CAMNT_0009237655 /DNA_START=84 /DNA_END=384 /DNA_ORIENTATION=+
MTTEIVVQQDLAHKVVCPPPQYLCSFQNRGDYRNPTEFIRLNQCSTVKSQDGKENGFCVVTPDRTFNLIANDNQDKEKWIGAIGRQMVRRTAMTEEYED